MPNFPLCLLCKCTPAHKAHCFCVPHSHPFVTAQEGVTAQILNAQRFSLKKKVRCSTYVYKYQRQLFQIGVYMAKQRICWRALDLCMLHSCHLHWFLIFATSLHSHVLNEGFQTRLNSPLFTPILLHLANSTFYYVFCHNITLVLRKHIFIPTWNIA